MPVLYPSELRGRPCSETYPSARCGPIVRRAARPGGIFTRARTVLIIKSGCDGGKSNMADDNKSLRAHSSVLVDGPSRAPARAMFKAVGFTDEDLSKPLIGVGHTWTEIMPCTAHLRGLAEHVKRGIRAAGGTPIEFNTIAICDGIAMGTAGMRASLISREVIADSMELSARGHLFDGMVAISGCDKTIPATVMALLRLDLPSLMIYGGSIQPGRYGDLDVTIQEVFEAVGAQAAGKIDPRRLEASRERGVSGRRARVAANSPPTLMATAPRCSESHRRARTACPLPIRKRPRAHFRAGERVMELLRNDLRPSRIITRKSTRERDRLGRDDWRLDQRGAASARDRARSGSGTRHRRLRSDQLAHAAARRPQARGRSSRPTCIAPAESRSSRSASRKRACCMPAR